jgi:hypothetical protein
LLLVRERSRAAAVAMGALASLLAFNRPPDVFFAVAVSLAYLWRRRTQTQTLWMLVGAAAVAAPFLIYNLVVFKHPAGGYGMLVHGALAGSSVPLRARSAMSGFAALLVSPGKGLLVYSPFLLFIAGAAVLRFPGHDRVPAVFLWAAFVMFVLVHSFTDWRAGYCYGPRFLTDALPFLTIALLPAVEKLSGWRRKTFLVSVLFAIVVQAIGAFCFPGGGSEYLPQKELWKPSGAQFYREAKAGPQREDYVYRLYHWLRAKRTRTTPRHVHGQRRDGSQ